jgi:hypothetical protein
VSPLVAGRAALFGARRAGFFGAAGFFLREATGRFNAIANSWKIGAGDSCIAERDYRRLIAIKPRCLRFRTGVPASSR